jgi:hypothetical protein
MMDAYREMLTYIKSAVTRNYSEKCINNIMDFVSGSASQNFGLLQEFYQTTLRALEEAKNEVRVLSYSMASRYCLLCPRVYSLLLCRDFGSRQILNFAKYGLIWVNMGE